jgi:hypothetical protein
MVRRVARRGRNAGSSFWGCSFIPNVQRHLKRLSAVLDRLSRGHTLATLRLISIISQRAHRQRLFHDASLRVNMIESWPTVSTFVTWHLLRWRTGGGDLLAVPSERFLVSSGKTAGFLKFLNWQLATPSGARYPH